MSRLPDHVDQWQRVRPTFILPVWLLRMRLTATGIVPDFHWIPFSSIVMHITMTPFAVQI
jgi:hypothetical protein